MTIACKRTNHASILFRPIPPLMLMTPLENLLSWCERVLQYLTIQRLAVGLNETEQQLLEGLQEAVDQVTEG